MPAYGRIETASFDCGSALLYEVEEERMIYQAILSELGYDVDVNRVKNALRRAMTGRV